MLPQKGERCRARVAWRQQDEAGVTFLQAGGESVVSIEMARLIKRLETDRVALRARVAELTQPM